VIGYFPTTVVVSIEMRSIRGEKNNNGSGNRRATCGVKNSSQFLENCNSIE